MKLKLPEGPFEAYLFDCDGTIADSMPLHYLGWKHVLADWSCEFAEEHFYSLGGMPVTEIIAMLNERDGSEHAGGVRSRRRKEEFFFGNLSLLKGIPEVLEHIELSHRADSVRGGVGWDSELRDGVVAVAECSGQV